MEQIKVLLNDEEIPRQWYNIMADFPKPPAPPVPFERAGYAPLFFES